MGREGRISVPAAADDGALIEVLRQAQDLGFIGPGSLLEQVRHGKAFAAAVARSWARSEGAPGGVHPRRVVDLGSGGGLPALVVARAWPDVHLTLIEAQHRRAAFLADASDRLGLGDRTEVVEGRAENVGHDPHHRAMYEAATVRAFGPPSVAAECGSPLLQVGGVLVVSEPPAALATERWPQDGLAMLGMGAAQRVGDGPHFVVVPQVAPCPDRYARRVGVPAKRPLF